MKKKTKRILAGLAAFLIIVCSMLVFTGCKAEASSPSMFVEVEDHSCWKVLYHKDTKVMYSVSYGGHAFGVFTLLVNADGTPMLWEGD